MKPNIRWEILIWHHKNSLKIRIDYITVSSSITRTKLFEACVYCFGPGVNIACSKYIGTQIVFNKHRFQMLGTLFRTELLSN